MFGWFSSLASPKRLKEAGVMGMNDRNYSIIAKYNKRRLYPLVDDKVQTKILANKIGINTPHMIGVIKYQYQVKNILSIVSGHKEFVVKPAHGSGGQGVLVIRSYTPDSFETPSGRKISFKELYQHISNILSGLYSLGGKYDVALIEERYFQKLQLSRHSRCARYCLQGFSGDVDDAFVDSSFRRTSQSAPRRRRCRFGYQDRAAA